jgi:hypothetical protein
VIENKRSEAFGTTKSGHQHGNPSAAHTHVNQRQRAQPVSAGNVAQQATQSDKAHVGHGIAAQGQTLLAQLTP